MNERHPKNTTALEITKNGWVWAVVVISY